MLIAGYGLVIASLLAAGVVRWRHRLFFVALLLVGMIIAVGPSPYASPTPLGAVFKAFANSSSAGLALRSTARAVPLVVLALAIMLGLGVNVAVGALRRRGHPVIGAVAIAAVIVLIAVNMPALFNGTFYGKNLERPENVPAYWTQATKYLDAQGDTTRVLEEPGADFAAYTWGNTVDPITPGLMNRPYVARELIPYGTAGTADLLNAFDRRFQEGVADPAGVVALLQRMGIGDVVLRNDIQYQRYNLVSPRELNRVFARIPGLGKPIVFGAQSPSSQVKPAAGAREEDESDLAAPANEPSLNPVVVYPVDHPTAIVRAESAKSTLMISGDGEGLVDVSDVGLLAAAGATQYSASYATPAALRSAVAPDAALVVTDENRSRARIWSSVLDNVGYTEQAGEKPLVADPNDARLPLFPGESPAALTTTQQHGIKTIQASAYGNTITYTPEDRAARALDGDTATAWRADAFGQRARPVHPLAGGRADHDRSREPRATAQRAPQPLDHEGAAHVRREVEAVGRPRRVVTHAAGADDLLRVAPVLDARDQDHRCERRSPQALRRRRRRGLRRNPPPRRARRPRRASRRGRADAPGSARRPRSRRGRSSVDPRDDPRRGTAGPAAHRSGVVDRANVRSPRSAHLRAHRQRQRQPGCD